MASDTVLKVLLGIALGLIILMTVVGNVVVCLAVGASRRLRCVTNCFIVSLAVADLLLGLLVLPLSAMLELMGGRWPLGATFCNIYVSLDVMLCTASILNLFAISVDRYVAVTVPLRYPGLVTPARVAVAMAFIWAVSLLLSFLPIQLGWNTPDLEVQNRRGRNQSRCLLELNRGYALFDALATFYLPLLVMCGTYYRIFRIARGQARRINSRPSSLSLAASVREHKATATLAAVLGAFIVCWVPYFTYFTYIGWREGDGYSPTTFSVVLWLGYANSTLNPILYAALNRDFRSAYGRLLCRRVCPAPLSHLSVPSPGDFVLLCAHTNGCRERPTIEAGQMLQERNTNGSAIAGQAHQTDPCLSS
ncbi:histamine H2 receptor-like [Conger conger]|uniref:histamine H2 receptor-like n=1 Tax=Conger conger TaxID=82655 RepID=UPI002A5A52B4|nr:histamine H2 receptor-like [Conger conger]